MKSSGFADILEASKIYKPTVIEGICFYYINYNNTTTLLNERLQKSYFRTLFDAIEYYFE